MATLDTLQDAVNTLTSSTTTLVNEVQVKKATLDASVADAEAAQTAAAASASTASGHAASAAASASAAAATASGISGFDLNAIAATKGVTAVDVFVYDTSKDSDGGAWRKRTQHTSWYNETLNTTTRGSRREFPAVAVIVAVVSDGIKIYDGDDPSLPLWMEFDPGSVASWGVMNLMSHGTFSSVSMVNGKLSVGMTSGDGCLNVADFVSDTGYKHHYSTSYGGPYKGNIAERNDGKGYAGPQTGVNPANIVNGVVNDVAMTVLPDAPIDPATGLPVPTIAVATAGGVSVIKDDGTVVDITGYSAYVAQIGFTENNRIFTNGQFLERLLTCDIPSADVTITAAPNIKSYEYYGGTPKLSAWKQWHEMVATKDAVIIGSNSTGAALNIVSEKLDDLSKGMVAYTTSTYNTGWMNGDIKGAFLSDTDDTDLVGSGELVTNGEDWTGASGNTPPTGWSTASSTIQFSVASGELSLDRNSEATAYDMYQNITTVVGETYVLYVDIASITSGALRVDIAGAAASYTTLDGLAITFTATSTSTYVGVRNTVDTGVTVIRSLSVKLADADRSVNNKGLIVNGTVTRNPVATGADLVAYSGFSTSNYLEQPYNSDLDFGTADFCVMGWVKGAVSASTANIVSRCSSGTTGFQLYKNTTSATPFAVFRVGSVVLNGTTGITDQWNHIVAVRKSGVAYVYKNGVLEGSVAATGDVSGSYVTQVGWSTTNPLIAALAGAALIRISATAPTAEQVAKIYQDEKVLFQENAQATLYGTSDAVTALAHDPVTDLLHVGTSAGRSVFQGLRRVSNTTTAVGTAISASGSLVVEE